MVEFSISNARYNYVHDQNYPSQDVDIHHILLRRSAANYLFVYALALLLLACAIYLYLFEEKSISLVFYSLLFDILLVKLLLRKPVNKESVVIMPAFGVQLETHYMSGKVIRSFVPIDKILKPVLLECVTPVTCYWTLSLIVREESEMVLVFKLAQLEMDELVASDASDSDDSEDDNETDGHADKKARKKAMYIGLLGNNSDEDAEEDGVQDMEVTFNTGLEDISKHIMEKKDKKSKTVWEENVRKQREKTRARRNKSKYSSDDDDDSDNTVQEATEEAEDFFMGEPDITKKKKKKAESKNDKDQKLQDMDGVSKEELELLLADDKGTDTGLKGYNLKFKKGKSKKTEGAIDEGKIPNAAYDDPRFASIYSPDFAVDPTDPQFKRSAVYVRQLAQKQQKGHMELPAEKEHTKFPKETKLPGESGMTQKGEEEGLDDLKSKKDNLELSSMVKSIKMKSKQIKQSSNGKTNKDGKSQLKGREKRKQ